LANRDNATVLEDSSLDNVTKCAQERALQITFHGGIKTTQLAGEILNNKNDKKGHHDFFHFWWLSNVGKTITFPDICKSGLTTVLLMYIYTVCWLNRCAVQLCLFWCSGQVSDCLGHLTIYLITTLDYTMMQQQ
jgi:imidazole glycerol phosphate synthase subunit HisF